MYVSRAAAFRRLAGRCFRIWIQHRVWPMDSHYVCGAPSSGKNTRAAAVPELAPLPRFARREGSNPWDRACGLARDGESLLGPRLWVAQPHRPKMDFRSTSAAGRRRVVPQRYNNGSIQRLYEMLSTCDGASNSRLQNWQSSHQQYNNGSMDGWAIGGAQDKPLAMGYLTKKHLPFFNSIGETFAVNDRFFAVLPSASLA